MARRGTLAKIDLKELEKLAMLQCTDEEIAAWFGVHVNTIMRRRKSPKFAAIMERGKAKGRISVRRQQMKLLEAGNATMGVWLGKNVLGQVDQVNVFTNHNPQVVVMMPAAPRPSLRSSSGVIDIEPAAEVTFCPVGLITAAEEEPPSDE